VRAMILAAGLGTRLRPLSDLLPKPALPVRGLPLVAPLLHLLRRHGVTEVVVNLHHLPAALRAAVEQHAPAGLAVRFSEEAAPLGTGGGIRRVAAFLRQSDPCLVVAGDMLLDAELSASVALHRERGAHTTLLLREDPRAEAFGTLGVDEAGRVRRVARLLDLGGEKRAGVFVSARIFSARALDDLPERDAFEDLRDWLVPRLAAGARDVWAEVMAPATSRWTPVGRPAEYLRANLEPPWLSYLDLDGAARARGVQLGADLVLGAGAVVGPGARLERVVVWDGERVPGGSTLRGGVFARGRFHACEACEDGGASTRR
jgi:NDP-sugar pyrophosphorylase family protein